MAEVLVVYFSRTGTTRRAAEAIASVLGGDIEPLLEPRSRRGLLGYLRSGYESLRGKQGTLLPLEHDPAAYERVVIGTPVWNGSVSTPVRTFVLENRGRLPRLAFFATEGSSGGERALQQLEQLAGRSPEATLLLKSSEVEHGLHLIRVERFAELLRPAPRPAYVPEPPGAQA